MQNITQGQQKKTQESAGGIYKLQQLPTSLYQITVKTASLQSTF